MSNTIHRMRRSVDSGVATFGAVVLGLLAVFWASAELHAMGVEVPVVRPAAGLFLLFFAPGALAARLAGIRPDRFGRFALIAVALSFGAVVLVTLFGAFVLAPLGVDEPLSFLPLAGTLSVVLAALVALAALTGRAPSVPRVRLAGSVPVVVGLAALPALAAAAVVGVEQFGTNVGMFLFVGAVMAATLLTASRLVPATLYPLAVFSVSASVLAHRNLLTGHVVGADIQASYYIADMLLRTGRWAPDLGGSMMSLAAVTSVPAAVTTLTGLELAATFKLVYAFLFSLVPVGVYYVGARLFDEGVGLYGGLFFVFYHGSFYFTPGKQLVSELSVVAALLVVVYWGVDGLGRKAALAVLGATLVSSHYGMTYALGGTLAVGYLGLEAVRRFVGDFDHRLSPWYPVALLGAGTAFYAYSAPDLVGLLASMPVSIADQVVAFALTGTVPGSGASYVQSETGLLDTARLALYALLIALAGLGLARDALSQLAAVRRGDRPVRVEYTAIAIPFFAFLGASYVAIPNLWADRVYQLVLTLLAPYAAFGYRTVAEGAGAVLGRTGAAARADGGRVSGVQWSLLAVGLAALLALNSGLAFSVAGAADTSSFNPRANDLTFTGPERDAAEWVGANVTAIERYDRLQSDVDGTVPVYTESRSYQLFRALALPAYTNADLRYLKSRWQPTLFPDRVDEGYVFVRERSVEDAPADALPPSKLAQSEVGNLSETRNRVYVSESARVFEANSTVE